MFVSNIPSLRASVKIPIRATALAGAFFALASVQAGGGDPPKHTAPKGPPPLKKRDLSKGNTLFVVPYAHLDTQWRWAYPQVIRDFLAKTLHDNFALIEKYPHYVFNFSGSRRYEMMKEYYPEEYEQLKSYIQAGRWFPCGSSVDEGDSNVPSAESLIRHVLYGNHYFRREFGTASNEFMLPDCFGFAYALPSILAHCGVHGFSTQKLTWGSAVGIPFKVGTWEGPDGKSIVAALDPGSYGGGVDEDLSQNTSWLARIENTGKQSGAYVDYHYYGTGDTGGAPRSGSVDWVERSIGGAGPISVVSSRADEMFMSLTPQQIAKLPHYKGELLLTQHSAGSITSEAYMKRWNRKNELLADGAEKASVAAMWLGATPYPGKRLYDAWDLFLGSQMHDMLPGTSIPKAYEFCWNDELLALNQFGAVETDAVGAVASAMDTRPQNQSRGAAQAGPVQSLIVYNPLSIVRADPVEATVPEMGGGQVTAFGPDGLPVPTQVIERSGGKMRVLFRAEVPATGFATYELRPYQLATGGLSAMMAGGREISNGHFTVKLNRDGDIASIYDWATHREALKAPIRLAFVYHNPVAYPAWNMDWQDASRAPTNYVSGPAKISVVENGLVRVALRVERETSGSKFIQDIRLTAGGDQVEVANKIDWQTREHVLKATFPLTTGNPEATYDLQVGTVKRGNNNEKKYEVPQHQWLDLTKGDGSYGVAVLNDSKYGSDKPGDDTVRLTMIYTPGVRAGYDDQATQDFGKHDILFALAPHAGDWRRANVPWLAKRLNQPLRAYLVPAHAGNLGRSFSLASTNTQQVEIQAIKKAEDSGEVVIRLRELDGKPAHNVQVRLASGILSAREIDGQERPIGTATVKSGALITNVSAYSLRAFALKLAPSKAVAAKDESRPVTLPYDTDVASSYKNPTDGAFDAEGRTYSANQWPAMLTVDGIKFQLGPTIDRAKNAVTARGQKIALPAGYSRVYVLAAADGDVSTQLRIESQTVSTTIRDWSGYIGQWDNRLWAVDPGPNFTRYGDTMNGLAPGFVKSGEVAWYCSHRNTPNGYGYYQYTYLFKYGFDLPDSKRTGAGLPMLALPNDPRIRVFAVTVARHGHDSAIPAAPLFDQMKDHVPSGQPTISVEAGSLNDATAVTIRHPLYWSGGGLHYTVDGKAPTATSPVYSGPLTFNDPVTIKAAQIDASGRRGPVTTAVVQVHDTTPPRVVGAFAAKSIGAIRLEFSEALLRETAEDPRNYDLGSDLKIASASLLTGGRSVELILDPTLAAGSPGKLTVMGLKDLSKAGNSMTGQTVRLTEKGPLFTATDLEPKTSKSFNVEGLPVKASDPWTMNFFCRIDQQPEDRTMIAGFGRSVDGRTGTGRYFTKFPQGINFWVANRDVMTQAPLDIGRWQMLTATYDGKTLRLYKNGDPIGEEEVRLADDLSQVRVMPVDAWERRRRFGGEVRNFTIWDIDLSPATIKRLWSAEIK